MKIYKNGMTLMRDTASLTNALCENLGVKDGIKVGTTFCELMWTDRNLWVVTRVVSDSEFYARRARTRMENWADGTEYPVTDENGNIETWGDELRYRFSYRNWRRAHERLPKKMEKVHLAFGEKTGYRDPSF